MRVPRRAETEYESAGARQQQRPPEDAASTFEALAARGWNSHNNAELVRAAAGLRNFIGYGYAELDHERLHAEARPASRGAESFSLPCPTLLESDASALDPRAGRSWRETILSG
jgi:hypothetical protein